MNKFDVNYLDDFYLLSDSLNFISITRITVKSNDRVALRALLTNTMLFSYPTGLVPHNWKYTVDSSAWWPIQKFECKLKVSRNRKTSPILNKFNTFYKIQNPLSYKLQRRKGSLWSECDTRCNWLLVTYASL